MNNLFTYQHTRTIKNIKIRSVLWSGHDTFDSLVTKQNNTKIYQILSWRNAKVEAIQLASL